MATRDTNLIVNMTFNPPLITIIGAIKDTTIQKLNTVLPTACTSTFTGKTKFAFEHYDSPPHWAGVLPASYANEEVGQSQLVLSLLDALEEEGGWKLKGSNATNHDVDKVTYKFFFIRTL